MLTSDVGPLPADLAGRRAVVTGAASGIGLAIADRLARAGARVVAVDKDKDGLAEAFDDARFERLDVTPVYGDLASPDVTLLADELSADGPIELIVNNVGVCTGKGFFDTTEADVQLVFQTNLFGPWFFTKRLVERLIRAGRPGSILFVSSLHDHVPVHRPQYSTSKAGVTMLVRELAHELPGYGIRVNAISPGWIKTNTSTVAETHNDRASRAVPMRRAGTPDDVARAAVLLLSDVCSPYVNGEDFRVDGGLSLYTWRNGPEG